GRCTEFSPDVVNQFLGRSTTLVPAMLATNDDIGRGSEVFYPLRCPSIWYMQ
ncbi:hypothetical protein A2U01_0079691, partial [Trifolium medium]|nr:hypothetical protein [Trifolium medium]